MKNLVKVLLVLFIIFLVIATVKRAKAQEMDPHSGVIIPRDVVVVDTLIEPGRAYDLRFVAFDSIRAAVYTYDDTVWSNNMSDYVHYSRINMGHRMNWGIKHNKRAEKAFWYGTASMCFATGFYVASAYSDPVIYIETHSKFTRNYYDKALLKRNVKIAGGVVFTGLAVYYYYKVYDHGKKSRWIISPTGVQFNF